MTSPIPVLDSATEFLTSHEGVICDLWGVVHNGVRPHKGAVETLVGVREKGVPVLLLSNAPRPYPSVEAQLDALGVPKDAYDGILTSGDLTRDAIAGGGYGKIYLNLGPSRDHPTTDGLDLIEGDIDTADFILCTGLYDDITEQPSDYEDLFKVALRRKLAMVCANPDIVVQRGDEIIYCAGALADLYRKMGGAAVLYGKPEERTFVAALARLSEIAARDIPADRAVMIGDGLKTDITGANRSGLASLLIAHGIHGEELGYRKGRPLDGARVAKVLAGKGLTATAAMAALEP